MRDAVFAVERAYVAAATSTGNAVAAASTSTGKAGDAMIAAAAIGAVASRFLAVGTPRSIGLIGTAAPLERDAVQYGGSSPGDVSGSVVSRGGSPYDARSAARLSLEAHRVWFAPTDVRVFGAQLDDVDPAARLVSIDEALAADIVCVHAPIVIGPRAIRRGTHVNILVAMELDPELAAIAQISREVPDLAALAAGLIDGRQLDEITIFAIGDAAIARAAIG